MNVLEKPLLKSLLEEIISYHELMNAYNIKTTIDYDLDSSVLGFVYLSRRGHYHLIINGSVNFETQCKTFIHEVKHIVDDMPKVGYFIGLDMQHSDFEIEAENFSKLLYGGVSV